MVVARPLSSVVVIESSVVSMSELGGAVKGVEDVGNAECEDGVADGEDV